MATLSATTADKMANSVDNVAKVLAGQTDPGLHAATEHAKEVVRLLKNYGTRNPDKSTPGQLAADDAQKRQSARRGTTSVLDEAFH